MALIHMQEIQEGIYSDVAALEAIYDKAHHDSDSICSQELNRKLRIRIRLLESEIHDLHKQLTEDDDHILNLDSAREAAQQELSVVCEILEAVNTDVRLKSREIETLKVELLSLRDMTMDSNKLLSEKLSLAREVSTLKPELDYLRSQSVLQQSILKEKLFFEQECAALKAELDSIRKSAHRASVKEKQLHAQELHNEGRVETLMKEIAAERKEHQRIEREYSRAVAESEAKHEILSSRLDAFRTKLKSTKEQPKATQENVKIAQETTCGSNDPSYTNKAIAGGTVNARKRKANFTDEDTIIGTPGVAPAVKKGKRASALPGDKSMFSTTPFLNRTLSAAPESPESEQAATHPASRAKPVSSGAQKSQTHQGSPAPASVPSRHVQIPSTSSRNSEACQSLQPSKGQARVHPRKPMTGTTLELVAEEEVIQAGNRPTEGKAQSITGMKTKKRKLLGNSMPRTIFVEEEADPGLLKQGLVATTRPLRNMGRSAISSQAGTVKLGAVQLNGAAKGFSPLKKDRRGGTSFLT